MDDHIFMTFTHPGGCIVELSNILSNDYGGLYEEYLGSKGSLILSDVDGAMLFSDEEGCVEGAPLTGHDETLPWKPDWNIGYRSEIWTFAPRCAGAPRFFADPSERLGPRLSRWRATKRWTPERL